MRIHRKAVQGDLKTERITAKLAAAYSLQQNEIAERKNRTIMEIPYADRFGTSKFVLGRSSINGSFYSEPRHHEIDGVNPVQAIEREQSFTQRHAFFRKQMHRTRSDGKKSGNWIEQEAK